MDPITQQTVLAAAGAAGKDSVYVDDVFSTYLYTGTGAAQSINNGIDLAGEGGLVWIKNRQNLVGNQDHALVDSERTGFLRTNATSGESTQGSTGISLNANGFSISTSYSLINGSSIGNYTSWTFRKAPGFFDVVTYTGNSVNGRQIPHALGSTPGMVIVKRLNGNDNWTVQHRSLGGTKSLYLNSPSAQDTSASEWNNTAATSTVFTVGTSGKTNNNGDTYVAYIFAHDDASFGTNEDESIIKCGSYVGNGGTKPIDLGFETQWVMIKNASSASNQYGNANWYMADTIRGMDVYYSLRMYADENFNDGIAGRVRPTATGFSIVNESENDYNESGSTYIYMAIRRPNKPPTAATEVFAIDTGNGSSTFPAFDSGFPVDLALYNIPGSPNNKYILSRLTGRYTFITNLSNAAFAENDTWRFESNVGWGRMSPTSSTYSWMFRRAPGFTDVVDYEGSNSATQNVIHNLTVAPELMIIKKRNATEDWHAYSASLGAGKYLKLNSNTGEITNTGIWNNTSPTSSVFTVGNNGGVNEHGDNYIALLFATLPGISKVGSYSGNGTARTIDCGFTNGARFVLIKRTDAAGSWLLFDTLRGISAGNDPFLQLNLTDAQYTSLDVIDPHSSGFNLTSSTAANNGGSEYIFFAIA